MTSKKKLYLNGNCHIFTLALHELTGLQIASFVEDRTIKGSIKVRDGLIHAFCVVDADKNLVFDANGIRNINEFNKEYNLHNDIRVRLFDKPNDLLEFDISFGERTPDVDLAIEEAKDFIETYLNEEIKEVKSQ